MALGDVGAFHDWLEREDPPYSLVRSVEAWIERLGSVPWQAPSRPIAEMTVEGEYQTRQAVVNGVAVIYSEDYPTGVTDLIDVRYWTFDQA